MRHLLLVVPLLLGSVPAALAQVSVSIGINLPVYPEFQRVPGYPVYHAPNAPGNYFFYDGLYWVFQSDNWYSSGWYNGPWQQVGPDRVPLFLLRVPVRYYQQPPSYFRAWRADAAPRWGEHWGRDWEQRRAGWDRWDRRTTPAPAPLPRYQGRYPQSRYPQDADQQRVIRSENYRYQPRDPVVREREREQWRDRPVQDRRPQRDNRKDERDSPRNDRGNNDRGNSDRANHGRDRP